MKTYIFLLVFIISTSGIAGDIRGTIILPTMDQSRSLTVPRYGYQHQDVTTSASSTPHAVRAVVYIDTTFADTAFNLPKTKPVMNQSNQQFDPYILPVLIGTTVEFPNNDNVYHNVFSFSEAKTFDLGKYPTATSKTVTFNQAGVVSLYCEIHSHMNAFILVLPNPFFHVLKADGKFVLHDVPPGRYRLRVFAGRGKSSSWMVSVPDSGAVNVEFSM